MATYADLVSKLKLRASIAPDERLSPTSSSLDDFLIQLIQDAIKTHNPLYTVASLPAAEEMLVLILAQIEVCYVRAEKVVNAAPVQSPGQGFSVAIDSPFKKNMDLAKRLSERYLELVNKLGVDSGTGSVVVQTTSYIKSDRLDRLFPFFNVPAAPPVTLFAEARSSTQVYLSWKQNKVDYFERNFVFWCLTSGIYSDWNATGVMTVPRIKSSASLFFDTSDQDRDAILASPFPVDTDLYFLLVTKTRQNKYTYSGEVMVHTPA